MTKKTKTTAPETIIAYKGFTNALACTGGGEPFQYEIGKTYEHDGPVKACKGGFHACEYPLDAFRYYSPADSRFAVVEQSGDLSRHSEDSKIASRKISIKAEIGIAGLVKAAIEYTTSRCLPVDPDSPAQASGDRGAAQASGDRGAAQASGYQGAAQASGYQGAAQASGYQGAAQASGDRGAAQASGDRGAAQASGDRGAAQASGDQGAAQASGYQGAAQASGYQGAAQASGDRGAAQASGDRGAAQASGDQGAAQASGYQGAAQASGYQGAAQALGKFSTAAATGIEGRARGVEGCALFLVYRFNDWRDEANHGRILHAQAVIVGQGGIKPDTWYSLDATGQVVEVNHE